MPRLSGAGLGIYEYIYVISSCYRTKLDISIISTSHRAVPSITHPSSNQTLPPILLASMSDQTSNGVQVLGLDPENGFRFLELPSEIRLLIYRLFMGTRSSAVLSLRRISPSPYSHSVPARVLNRIQALTPELRLSVPQDLGIRVSVKDSIPQNDFASNS